jgi:hypothetical protein
VDAICDFALFWGPTALLALWCIGLCHAGLL